MSDDTITKRGRPSKATPQKLRELVAVVRAIGFKSTTARKCGLNPDTLDNWLDKGEDGEEPFGEWRTEFLAAQAEWEAEQIDRASAQDPRWVLERQNPRVYGKPDPAAVSVNVSQTLGKAVVILPENGRIKAIDRDHRLDGLEAGEDK